MNYLSQIPECWNPNTDILPAFPLATSSFTLYKFTVVLKPHVVCVGGSQAGWRSSERVTKPERQLTWTHQYTLVFTLWTCLASCSYWIFHSKVRSPTRLSCDVIVLRKMFLWLKSIKICVSMRDCFILRVHWDQLIHYRWALSVKTSPLYQTVSESQDRRRSHWDATLLNLTRTMIFCCFEWKLKAQVIRALWAVASPSPLHTLCAPCRHHNGVLCHSAWRCGAVEKLWADHVVGSHWNNAVFLFLCTFG